MIRKRKEISNIIILILLLILLLISFLLYNRKRKGNNNNNIDNNQDYANQDLNNPGFLIRTNNNWLGKDPNYKGKFERFFDIKYGVRAAIKNIHSYYYIHNLRTVAEIINRWCPSNNNSYIEFVRARVGSESIDINDSKQLKNLMFAIFDFEGSKKWKSLSMQEREKVYNEAIELL